MNTFLGRIALALSLASAAHAQTCGDTAGDGNNVAITDADCAAGLGGNAPANAVADTAASAVACPEGTNTCDLDIQANFDACCDTFCDTYTCADGSILQDNPETITQDGTHATCCRDKTATDCDATTSFFCAYKAGTSEDPCTTGVVGEACDTCVSHKVEPAAEFAADDTNPAAACEENVCAAYAGAANAAAAGLVIAGLAGDETTVSAFVGKAISAADGWTFPTGLAATAAGVAELSATCTGTVTADSSDCAVFAGFDGDEANCPEGCTYTRAASITCEGEGVAFTVVGAVGMTCTMPTAALPGYDITGMTCENLQTGTIACSVLHTCDAQTHHPGSAGLSEDGPDGLPGTADDGVRCLSEGGTLEIAVGNAARASAADELQAGCNINMCNAPTTTAPDDGYTVPTMAGTIVADLGDVVCTQDDATSTTNAADTSTNWWATATCTGSVDDSVEGSDGSADCSTWPAWVRTLQPEDCPTGCTYDNTAATVTCVQAAGELDTANDFQYTGCSQAKCNDLTGNDDSASTVFESASCSAGMSVRAGADLERPCAGDTCTTWDCCTDDDGCDPDAVGGVGADGFDGINGNSDDGMGPCYNTNSACVDVPAPGVGNTCVCCDGSTPPSLRDPTEANGGCNGKIGYFGAPVTSAAVATSALSVPVQGSCTACTPIANSAEDSSTWADPNQSGASDVDEADKMVTCEEADNSRAVACVTGAITVSNVDNEVSDVCRLECPFTEVVALIDRLHIHTDGCAAVDLVQGAPSVATQIADCEAVAGCYYTPCTDTNDDGACADDEPAATCRPIYAGCNEISTPTEETCETNGPKLSGSDNTLATADDVAACTFDGSAVPTTCKYTPAATDYTETITRCDALLATGWAHDLRDSCDATRACPLHGAVDANPPGMIAMVKEVYTAPGVAPAGTDTWAAGNAPQSPATLSLDSADAAAYFVNDADATAMSDWDVCMNIRDAVLAAPTCSAGSGR